MATASKVAEIRQVQRDIVALAYAEIAAFWRTIDTSDPVAVVLALEEFLPEVIEAYGEMGAAAAADFYDDLRFEATGATGAYKATVENVVNLEQVRGSAKWAAAPLFKRAVDGHLYVPAPDTEGALARIVSMTDRLVKKQYRDTIAVNVERDPARARFARVPQGPTTCAFCLMLASRGAVYSSGRDAGWEMGKYHDDCDCVPTPMWDGDTFPEGYDPEALRDTYKQALKTSDTGELKGSGGVLSAIRENEGVK